MRLRLEFEEDCTRVTYYPKHTECRDGKLWDYSGQRGQGTDEDCPRCHGRGKVLTDLGREIVALVRRWDGVKEEDWLWA